MPLGHRYASAACGVNATIRNGGTERCLSANFNNAVYTTACSGVVYHDWVLS